jgi:hypothetical protein
MGPLAAPGENAPGSWRLFKQRHGICQPLASHGRRSGRWECGIGLSEKRIFADRRRLCFRLTSTGFRNTAGLTWTHVYG